MRTLTALLALLAPLALATACDPASQPTAGQSGGEAVAGQKKGPVPIKLVAKRAAAAKSVLSDGGALSCVRVTVTNQTKKNLEVNPLYFSLTDTSDIKHDASLALGDYEGQIDTTSLAPKEKASGLVCSRGSFTPKTIAMTNPLFSEAARAQVVA
ncbi:DUF4352 domain-containing protein [Actinomadura roseirufa]|uniref:DUF4352 domain-containing protein n=1 Tax=Actinomadura roseirufa TaxID=2094049 RepID=UPI00104161B4|nr:DUF4352 domain-containing protein [Actinomadura roseirufa]